MMKIRHILYLGTALLMAGCSSDEKLNNETSAEDRIPLQIEATLNSGSALTRAAGNEFVSEDVLLAYIRHTTGAKTGNPLAYPVTNADQAPKLVALKKGNEDMDDENTEDGIKETSNLTSVSTSDYTTALPLYWDDFSNSASADTDLRTSGHGLQSYYGYCYNGGTPSTALTDATGVLGWTIGNQTTAEAVQHADLLWSAEQDAVAYGHATARDGEHGTLTIPYTHAMSEITVTITANKGFETDANPLSSTVLTLNAMNTVTSFTAPTGAFTSDVTASVTMFGGAYTGGKTRNYTAIVAPGTKLKEGVKLLDITNVADNNYTVTITSSMLTSETWQKDHTGTQIGTEDGKAYVYTQPGVNYHLNITVDKSIISTKATLAAWKTVNASGEGDIVFNNDDDEEHLIMDDTEVGGHTGVRVVAVDKNLFVDGASFSLFTLKSTTDNSEPTARINNDVYDFATVSTFQDNAGDANDQWNNSPEIYWPNKTDNYYFRALAKFNGITDGANGITQVGTYNSDKGTAVSQGFTAENDILWGTTAKHYGTTHNVTYERGQSIPPRTGGVPIAFEHAMSKVTFQLETVSATDINARVDLTDASIAVTNLYTAGTITIENGSITYTNADMNSETATLSLAAIPTQTAPITNLLVIPQVISDNAEVIITLADGTTYKLQLKSCMVTSSNDALHEVNQPITQWRRGANYTYTIHLEKERITFRAVVKDWDNVTGSGNANLEWD